MMGSDRSGRGDWTNGQKDERGVIGDGSGAEASGAESSGLGTSPGLCQLRRQSNRRVRDETRAEAKGKGQTSG